MQHTVASLVAFEQRVADAFLAKQILAPVHLGGSVGGVQEQRLIEIFRDVRPEDHKFADWRSHFVALLSGVTEEELFAAIIAGRSMFFSSAKHRILCSAIVGGILPIACGVALGIKRRGCSERVWVFIGDATAETGLFHEFKRYCRGHGLPVRVVVSDNGLSTNSPTQKTWGMATAPLPETRFEYERVWPHVGCGVNVQF